MKLYVCDRTFPAHIFLVDLKIGVRNPGPLSCRLTQPACLTAIAITPDGKTSAYRYRRAVTTLYLAEGLK